MSFGTKEVKEKEARNGKFITYGKQKLMIKEMSVETAKTGSKRVVFQMEGEPVTQEGWQGEDGAKGMIGKIRTGYIKAGSTQETEFNENINYIAAAVGVKEEVKALGTFNTIEEFIEQLNNIITNKFAWFLVKGVEYQKKDFTTGTTLEFVRYGFVSKDETKLKDFNKNDKYHYVPLALADTEVGNGNTDNIGF